MHVCMLGQVEWKRTFGTYPAALNSRSVCPGGCQRLYPKFERFYKFFSKVQQGEWKSLRGQFSQLVDEVADFQSMRQSGEQRV